MDDTTQATKLLEAVGVRQRMARWIAHDTRSGWAHIWAGLTLLNVPYYTVFLAVLVLFWDGDLPVRHAMPILFVVVGLYGYGTRQLVNQDIVNVLKGIADDLDTLEARVAALTDHHGKKEP